ncbi:ACP S-malonyltransferase [Clostridiaceae bacterium M8S5]|nr:ACP S-malonyltransferase [Clostridiaceae bacterium M8S5]
MNKIALLFPGQASQYVGMGKDLYDKYDKVKDIFKQANEALGMDLAKLCFEGDIEELTKTQNTQAAILTVSYSAYNIIKELYDIKPTILAGHSLGEYTALVCSGALSFIDAVKIVYKRGQFMQEASAEGVGKMAAIGGLDSSIIEDICCEFSTDQECLVISNYNAPNQIVISGHSNAVEKACEKLKKLNAVVIPLKVSAAFHSPLMKPAASKLKNELMKYKYSELKYPVISNVTAKPYETYKDIITNLTKQLEEPVHWSDSVKYLDDNSINVALEIGPKTVLKNLMKKNKFDIKTYSTDVQMDMQLLKEEMLKETREAPSVITRCLAIAVCTKNYNYDNEEYKNGVILPYKEIEIIRDKVEKEGIEPSIEQMSKSLDLLKQIFITKKTPKSEQEQRFKQIFEETNTKDILNKDNRYVG